MQLGELQHQISRFESRNVEVVAVSVDAPNESLAMIDRLGLSFALGADPDQALIQTFRVQNPDTQELAIHAVYLIAPDGEIFYRKVGRRRPVSAELIDAIDYFLGDYPRTDEALEPRQRIAVAYPRNDFRCSRPLAASQICRPRSIRAVLRMSSRVLEPGVPTTRWSPSRR